MGVPGKKLLVLDVNGLLIDTYYEGETRPDQQHDEKVHKFYVYKRPFCDEFIHFCLENFVVGVWSSALEHNVLALVDYVFKETKEKLAFIWHQQHCTDTGFRHPDNKYKPLFLKELWRMWKTYETNLPWAEGDFGPSNTLLIDDSAYKAINNPPHTAIFPKTYKATDLLDNYLDGELRTYLEGVLESKDVQAYLQGHPIGEPSIAVGDPQWSEILHSVRMKNEKERLIPAHLVPVIPGHIHSPDHWRRMGIFNPVNIAKLHMGGDDQTGQVGYDDLCWDHPEHGLYGQGNHYGGKFSPGWSRGFPGSDAGPPWALQPRPGESTYLGGLSAPVLPHQIPPFEWRRQGDERFPDAFHQGLDYRWESPDLGPQLIGHGGLGQSGWGSGISEGDMAPHWLPGPRRNETAHLVGNSLPVVPDPMLPLEWKKRVGNLRSPLCSAANTGQTITDNSIPLHFSRSHHGGDVHTRGVTYENGHGKHPVSTGQLKAYRESGSFGPSRWVGDLSENDAVSSWPLCTRSNETQFVSDPNLPSERRPRMVEDRFDHCVAEIVLAGGNGKLMPVNLSRDHMVRDVQPQQGPIQSSQWEHQDNGTQLKSDHKSGSFSQSRLASGFSGSDTETRMLFQPRSDESHHLAGALAPHSNPSSDWQRKPGNKLPSSLDRRLDRRSSGMLQAANGNVVQTVSSVPRPNSECQTHRSLMEGSGWEQPPEVIKQKSDYKGERFSPSRWSPSRFSPSRLSPSRMRSGCPESDAGTSRPSRRRLNEGCHLVGITGLDPARPSDWPTRDGKRFASSFDQSFQLHEDETVHPGSCSDSRFRADTQMQRVAYDDSAWDRLDCVSHSKPDHYDMGRISQSERARDIPVCDAGPLSTGPRAYESGHCPLGKWHNSDFYSQRQSGGWFDDYKNTSGGGDRTRDNYQGRELYDTKRVRDSGDMERGWSVEQKDFYRVQSKDSHSPLKRTIREPMYPDDYTVSWVSDDRSHEIQLRGRARAREYEEPDRHHHWDSQRPDHRKDESQGRAKIKQGRDFQRHSDREYHSRKGRQEDTPRWDMVGERDYSKGYSQALDLNDDWNQNRISKRSSFR